MQHFYSVGSAAEHFSRHTGQYIPTHRVAAVVRRLIESGQIPRRAIGRAQLIIEAELQAVAAELGLDRQFEGGAE